MVAVSIFVTLARGLARIVPNVFKDAFIILEIYVLAAITIIQEFFYELTRSKAYRTLIEKILESRFIKQRLEQWRPEYPVVVISGADGTIGEKFVRLLLKLNFAVFALAGNAQKFRTATADLPSKERARVKVFQLDFTEPLRARRYMQTLVDKLGEVDMVILAAGTMLAPAKEVLGVEHHCWVNVISQCALLRMLESHLVGDARVIALSSVCSHMAEIDECPNDLLLKNTLGMHEAYARSKLLLSIFCEQLAQEWTAKSVELSVVSAHPGVVSGGLYRHTSFLIRYLVEKMGVIMRSPEVAAALMMSTAVRDDIHSGSYYEDEVPIKLRPDISEEKRHQIFELINARVTDFVKGERIAN